MASCCEEQEPVKKPSCCGADEPKTKKIDHFFWITLLIVCSAYAIYLIPQLNIAWISDFTEAVHHLMNTMFIGLMIGIFFVGLIGKIPKAFINAALGKGDSLNGIVRATCAGVLLDLCSHGILLVAMRLYERGASLGQVMAFLIASPWNSLSFTVILIALIGWQWTLLFLLASVVIGIISGLIFDGLVRRGTLPSNPHSIEHEAFEFWPEAKRQWQASKLNFSWWLAMLWQGVKDSRVLVRWLLLGVILAGLIRAYVPLESFQTYFGATIAGLGLTLIVATILEICSEGSTPVAADIVTRAQAPGNGFAFLMGGVSTDYTEIVTLREATKSWKVALFLPLVTLPQIVILAMIMNQF